MALVEGLLGVKAFEKDGGGAGRFIGDVLTLGGSAKERGAKEQAEAARVATAAQAEATAAAREKLQRAGVGAVRRIDRATRDAIKTQLEGFEATAGISKEATRDILRQLETEQGIDRTSKAFRDLQRKLGKGADQFAGQVSAAANRARSDIIRGQRGARAGLEAAQAASLGELTAGEAAARGALAGGAQAGVGALQAAQAQARGDIAGAQQAGLAQLDPALQQQQLAGQAAQATGVRDIVGAQPGLAEQQLAQAQERGFEGFEEDPGFQFALRRQEEAINRAAAARGGRLSGRTLRELQESSAGLAGQQFERFAQRRLAERGQELTAAQQIDARRLAALQSQAGLESQAGLAERQRQLALAGQGFQAGRQAAGLQAASASELARLGVTGAQDIARIRGAEGAGLAGLATQTAAQRARTQQGIGQQLAGIDLGTAQQLAQLGTTSAGQIGRIRQEGLRAQGQAGVQQAAVEEARAQSLLGQRLGAIQGGAQQLIGLQQGLTQGLTSAQQLQAARAADALLASAGAQSGLTQGTLGALAGNVPFAGQQATARGQTIGGLAQTAATIFGTAFGGPAGGAAAGGATGAFTGGGGANPNFQTAPVGAAPGQFSGFV